MMLYEVVAGRLPTPDIAGEIKMRRRSDVSPPSAFRPDVPEDLDRLCCALLNRSPGRRPRDRELLESLGVHLPVGPTASLAPHVLEGREDALEVLSSTPDPESGPRLVEIRGDPGIGKSALVAEHLRLAADVGTLVLQGRCSERESISFQGFDTVASTLAQRARREPDPAGETDCLEQLFPGFARGEAESGDDGRTAAEVRSGAVLQLAALLEALSPPAGTTIFLDDLHWADADTRWLLEALLLARAPARLLIATRPEEAARTGLTALLDRIAPTRTLLELGPIADDAAARLAATVLGPETADRVAEEARGVPLMVELLAASGRSTLKDAVRAILEQQAPEARNLAEVVALAGCPIPTRLALEAAGQPDALGMLVRLRAARLVRSASLRPEDPVEPWHDRIRSELVAAIAPEAAREHHEQLARSLASLVPPDPGRVGRHWADAGRHEEAVGRLLEAGRRALRDLAFDAAIALFEEAATSAEHASVDRSATYEALGHALEAAGRLAEAAPMFGRAADLATGERADMLHCRSAEAWVVAGRLSEGRAAFVPALSRRDLRSNRHPILAWMGAMARILWRGGATPTARQGTPAEAQQIDTLWSVARAHLLFDEQTAAPYLAASCRLALLAGDPARAIRGRLLLTMMLDQYLPKVAARALQAAEQGLAEHPDPHLEAFRHLVVGITTYNRGLSGVALPSLDAVSAGLRGRSARSGWECAIAEQLADCARIKLGRVHELRRDAEAQARRAGGVGDHYAAVYAAVALAWCDLAADDPHSARQRLDHSAGQWTESAVLHQQHWLMLAARLRCDLYEGRPEVAERRLLEAWPRIRKGYLLLVPETKARVLRLYGRVLAALPPQRQRTRLLRSTAHKLERIGRPEADGGAALLRAALACQAGEPARSAAPLHKAVASFDVCGMTLEAAAARARLAQLIDSPAEAAEALAVVRDAGVADPERWLELVAPGLTPA